MSTTQQMIAEMAAIAKALRDGDTADALAATDQLVELAIDLDERTVEDYQPQDDDGFLIVRDARITSYLGSTDETDRYLLELPKGEAHQVGPYEMRRSR